MSEPAISNQERNGYLETIGRVTGKPRTTEIWYSTEHAEIYLLSGYHNNKDWVKNFLANLSVRFRIGEHWYAGWASFVENDPALDLRIRRLLVAKYYGYDLESGDELPNEWSITATPVVIRLNEVSGS
jgi:deazaflavin-dependent oxidoreductase (nitroreductase family)